MNTRQPGLQKTRHRTDARRKLIDEEVLVEVLRDLGETQGDLPFGYFICLTFKQDRTYTEDDKRKIVSHFFKELAQKAKSHIKIYGGTNSWEHAHYHFVVQSENRLCEEKILGAWSKWGVRQAQDVRVLDPQREHLALGYTVQKHTRTEFSLFHPRTNRCRRGSCRLCNEHSSRRKKSSKMA